MEKKKIAKVVVTQVLVIGMCCALAFAGEDIFTRAESAVGGYEESVWSLIQKLVVVIGLIAGGVYILAPDDKMCQTGKKWFFRCIGGFALASALKYGWLTDMITNIFSK